jgi:hypothetical protein
MDLLASSLQAYEKHQNIAGRVQPTDTAALNADDRATDGSLDNQVSISTKREVFNWIAQSLPEQATKLAKSGPINQQLYEYGLLSIHHQALLNRLTEQKPEQSVIQGVSEALNESTSYQLTQQLRHIEQVFQTLSAAQQSLMVVGG